MGFYFRKSINFGGLKFNFSKSGIGVSTGVKGFRIGTGPKGNYVHMGRNGFYYRKSFGKPKSKQTKSNGVVPNATNMVVNQDFFVEADSKDVIEIKDSNSTELLSEINTKRKKFPLKWLCLLGLYDFRVLFGAFIIFAIIDYYRKTTVIVYDIEEDRQRILQDFYDSFQELRKCSKKWYVTENSFSSNYKYNSGAYTLLKRKPISLNYEVPKYIQTNVKVPCIPVGKQKLYFLPDLVLIDDGKRVGGVSYRNLKVNVSNTRYIETEMKPFDGTVIGHTYKYVNKDGSPDKRFANNYSIPIMQYTEIHFSSDKGISETVQFSKADVGNALYHQIGKLQIYNVVVREQTKEQTSKTEEQLIEKQSKPIVEEPLEDFNKIVQDTLKHNTKDEKKTDIEQMKDIKLEDIMEEKDSVENINNTIEQMRNNNIFYKK